MEWGFTASCSPNAELSPLLEPRAREMHNCCHFLEWTWSGFGGSWSALAASMREIKLGVLEWS